MTDKIKAWLDESQQLADKADCGPWKAYGSGGRSQPRVQTVVSLGGGGFVAHTGYGEDDERAGLDARLIAESRTRFPQAVAALRAVMELLDRWAPPDLHEPDEGCPDCEVQYQMRQAIADALGLEGDDDEL